MLKMYNVHVIMLYLSHAACNGAKYESVILILLNFFYYLCFSKRLANLEIINELIPRN